MKKRRLVYFLLLLLLLISVITIVRADYTESLYEDFVTNNQEIVFNNVTNHFSISEDSVGIQFIEPTGGIIVFIEECKEVGILNYCIVNISEDYHDYEKDRIYYKAEMEITQDIAFLEMTRTFGKTDLGVSEKTLVTVTIENKGTVAATNVEFEDVYSNFTFSEVDFCFVSGKKIFWSGRIDKLDKIECSYYIRPTSKMDFESTATLSYFNGMETEEVEDEQDLDVSQSLVLSHSISKTNLELNEPVNLTIMFNNTDSSNNLVITDLRMIIPASLKMVRKYGGATIVNGAYSWVGSITPESFKEFRFELVAAAKGDDSIKEEVSYTVNFVSDEISGTLPYSVSLLDLMVTSNLKPTFKENQKYNLLVMVENPSSNYRYKDIEVKVDSSFLNISETNLHQELKPKESFKIIDLLVTMPDVWEKTTYPITIKLNYKTEFNEILEQEKKLEIVVVPDSYVEVVNETVEDISEETLANLSQELLEKVKKATQNKTQTIVAEVKKQGFWGVVKGPLFLVLDVVVLALIIFVLVRIFKMKKKVDIFKDEK